MLSVSDEIFVRSWSPVFTPVLFVCKVNISASFAPMLFMFVRIRLELEAIAEEAAAPNASASDSF